MMSCLPADWIIFVTKVFFGRPNIFPSSLTITSLLSPSLIILNVATNKSLKFF